MKVCIFSLEYPPNIYGGVGIHLKYLTMYMKKFVNIEVRTIQGNSSRYSTKIKRYSPLNFSNSVIKVLSFNLQLVDEPIDADIVHTHTWYTNLAGMFAKKLYDTKLVATVHSLEPCRPWKREQLGSGYNLSCWMEHTGLAHCDKIIAVSKQMMKDLQKYYKIWREKIKVIPDGIDINKYRKVTKTDILEKYGINKPYVLYVGRVSRQKGIFDLISVSEKFNKNLTLVLLTGKPDTKEIVNELSERVKGKKNIIWINTMISENEKIQLYSHADVFVCPSIYEPFGITNLEAMACETPVVATHVGGIPEIVKDGKNGILIEPNKPQMIADAIGRIVNTKGLGKKMGRYGRRLVEKYSWEVIAQQTVELYKELIEK